MRCLKKGKATKTGKFTITPTLLHIPEVIVPPIPVI
jgi:hypothetical protein